MRRALAGRADIVENKMFGGYCRMLNGNMLCGVGVGRFMFRVGSVQEAVVLARPGAKPIDITGRPMRGFVWVDAHHAAGRELKTWIRLAERYVGSLPRKIE